MQNFFYRLFRLQPGEGGLVFALGFLLFGNSLARQVSNIVSVSGFLNSGGVNQMLLVLLIDYTIVLIVAMLQSLIVDRFNRVRMMGFVSIAFAVVFVILRLMFVLGAPGWLNYSVMYLVAEQQFVLFPIIFWVLANDVSSFSKSQRIFPLIASGGFIGKLVGIGIAGVSSSFFAWAGLKSEEILLFNSLIYVVAYIVILTSLRNVESRPVVQRTETARETMAEGWNFVRDVPSFRYLMLAVLALALADTIIEFRFLVITDAVFVGQTAYQNFYSLYRLAATLLAFGVQTFLTNRFISNVHLKNVFFVFPIVVLLGSGGMMLSAAIAMAVGTMLGLKLTRETVDESARKSFQALVPEERRGRVSMFMDSYLASIGTILACLITGAIVLIGLWLNKDLHVVYMAVAFLSGGFALWATFKLRKVYESSLLNWRLKRRQRATSSVLDSLDF
jgi:AAA family ATP:ADP antiporter